MVIWRSARHRTEATAPRVGGQIALRAVAEAATAPPTPTALGRRTAVVADRDTAPRPAAVAEARVGLGPAGRCHTPRPNGAPLSPSPRRPASRLRRTRNVTTSSC